jgi:hypothetical protein
MGDQRNDDLRRFYAALELLAEKVGGRKTLAECSGRLCWPQRGVYFFMEDGETRRESGSGARIVRVGTHALTNTSRTTLWKRLSQHRGRAKSGGGHHRGSIFRLIVGTAIIARDGLQFPTWGQGSNAPRDVRDAELALECDVSKTIGAMPFLWLAIYDAPGAGSLRGYIERNSIALLSNFGKAPLDKPSENWLGRSCNRERVRSSGLWNSNHVDEHYDPAFLPCLEQLVGGVERSR